MFVWILVYTGRSLKTHGHSTPRPTGPPRKSLDPAEGHVQETPHSPSPRSREQTLIQAPTPKASDKPDVERIFRKGPGSAPKLHGRHQTFGPSIHACSTYLWMRTLRSALTCLGMVSNSNAPERKRNTSNDGRLSYPICPKYHPKECTHRNSEEVGLVLLASP